MVGQTATTLFSTPAVRRGRSWLVALALTLAGFCALAQEARPAPVPGDFIVIFEKGTDQLAKARAERRRGNEVEDVFTSRVNGLVAELDPVDVERLEADPDVLVVEPDGIVRALAVRDSATPLWGLDRIDQRSRPGSGRITTATDGSGVTAYVVDTGIRSDHSQFEGRVAGRGFTAFSDTFGWGDCQGHGTHVAGTVAGKDYGVAPKANLVAVRVLGCDGSGSYSGVIAGLDWVVGDHAAGQPAVANLSLGGPRSTGMNAAIQRAVDDGVSVAVAAGNENSDACNVSPASAPAALTAGSTSSTDARSSFSNYGTCLDIFAPGSEIRSSTIDSPVSFASWSGTSMASPHVAGAAALALSGEPGLTPAEVATRLSSTSTTGVVANPGAGSLNRLLFVGDPTTPNPLPEPPPEPEPSPPPNDAFANAVTLSSLAGTSGTNVAATRQAGEPDHGWGAARSVWYRWTAPSDGSLTLATQGSGYDTVLAAYSGGSLSGLTQRAANDDVSSEDRSSRITFAVWGGTTYSIAVDGFSGATGSVRISGTFTPSGSPLDTTPPATPVLSGPNGQVPSRTASFTFSGEPGGTFYCSLDGGSWSPCTSPSTLYNLASGPHAFEVRQADAAGNLSPSATTSWVVDPDPPAAPDLTEAPDPVSYSTGATFAFSGEGDAEFECRLDEASFAACDSPTGFLSLPVGGHTFRVRQRDLAGNYSPTTTFTWEIRNGIEAQEATISGPDADGLLSFGGAEDGQFYVCRIGAPQAGPLEECQTPFPLTGLANGTHPFRLAIEDLMGNRSPETTGTVTVSGAPVPPAGQVGVSINGGDPFTTDPAVDLRLVWPAGTRAVILSNDGSLEGDSVPVANVLPWSLETTGSDRLPKTVYARFLGAGGAVLGTHTDDIVLDRTAPTVSAATMVRRREDLFTVRLAANDQGSGLARAQFSTSDPRGRATRETIRTVGVNGPVVRVTMDARPRWYRAGDRAGNWSGWRVVRGPGA